MVRNGCLCRTSHRTETAAVQWPGVATAPAVSRNCILHILHCDRTILADLPGAADAGVENLPVAYNHEQEIPVTGYNSPLKKGAVRAGIRQG